MRTMNAHDAWTVRILLLCNLIAAVVYLIIHLRRKDRRQGWRNFAFFLIYPVVGIAFSILAALVRAVILYLRKQGLDMNGLSFSKERMKILTDPDVERGLNTVPIEEALIVAKKKDKRNAFMDVLKTDDYQSMMGQIEKAVENSDMEVAHYAASVVTDSMAKFKAGEAALREKVDKDGSAENLSEYVDFMGSSLNPDMYSSVELRIYIGLFDKAARLLYEQNPDLLKDCTITQVVELLDRIGDSEKILPWIARAKARYHESLECFKLCARYYYKQGDRDRLAELVKEVRTYSVPLDNEALGWIRMLKLQ